MEAARLQPLSRGCAHPGWNQVASLLDGPLEGFVTPQWKNMFDTKQQGSLEEAVKAIRPAHMASSTKFTYTAAGWFVPNTFLVVIPSTRVSG